jgi:methionyl-tRNA formyltransferase
VADAARDLDLLLAQPDDLHAPESLDRIASVEPDVLIVCAYGVLVKPALLDLYETLNVHPSLLPRWRGAAPIERALMAGDLETGVGIMRLTEGLDEGPVCLMTPVPIEADDDFATLSARLEHVGGDLLVRALDERPPYMDQPSEGVTYAHKIEAADRLLDPARTPEELDCVVRALRPHVGARLALRDGDPIGVQVARPLPAGPAEGTLRAEAGRLVLGCRGGGLELLENQPPGGRVMAASAWLRGQHDPEPWERAAGA